MEDLSHLRNAAREYSNEFKRWIRAPKDSERESKAYGRMIDAVEHLIVIIIKVEAPRRERELALMQGLNGNKGAEDFILNVLRGM